MNRLSLREKLAGRPALWLWLPVFRDASNIIMRSTSVFLKDTAPIKLLLLSLVSVSTTVRNSRWPRQAWMDSRTLRYQRPLRRIRIASWLLRICFRPALMNPCFTRCMWIRCSMTSKRYRPFQGWTVVIQRSTTPSFWISLINRKLLKSPSPATIVPRFCPARLTPTNSMILWQRWKGIRYILAMM